MLILLVGHLTARFAGNSNRATAMSVALHESRHSNSPYRALKEAAKDAGRIRDNSRLSRENTLP